MHPESLLILLLQFGIVVSAPVDHPDRVTNLPGAPSEPVFTLYSGYIEFDGKPTNKSGAGLISQQFKFFYVLAEAIRADPLEAPLIVWLNGGPGASSLIGFIVEHGPYLLEPGSDKLRYNDFSWNQYANVLYIESPDWVGYSSSSIRIEDGNDERTADLNMRALHAFMTRVHPRYASRDFFLTGESYAGIYIPHFARSILQAQQDGFFTNSNFRGIALGNPIMDFHTALIASLMQMQSMGWIPSRDPYPLQWWTKFGNGISEGNINKVYLVIENILTDYLHYTHTKNATTGLKQMKMSFNLLLKCEREENEEEWHVGRPKNGRGCTLIKDLKDCQLRAHCTQSKPTKSQLIENIYREQQTSTTFATSMYPPYSMISSTNYRLDKAIRPSHSDFCSTQACYFIASDMDLACPALHVDNAVRLIADANSFESYEEEPFPEFINRADRSSSYLWHYLGDIAGSRDGYKSPVSNITIDVPTVRGAGHLVPMHEPKRAFQLINNFVFSDEEGPIDYSKMIRRKRPFHV